MAGEPDPWVSYEVERRINPQYNPPSAWEQIGTTSSTTYTDYEVLIDPYPTPDHETFEYRVAARKYSSNSYSNVVSIYAYPLGPTSEDDSTLASSSSAGGKGESATAASRFSERRPRSFSLKQNYPNPFAERTEICFDLPEAAHVELTVYDALGQVTEKLVDKELSSNTHCVSFNARTLSSGVYLYRLRAGEFTKVRRMIVVK